MKKTDVKATSTLLDNSRFYILAASVCLSFFIVCMTRFAFPDSRLWYIRTEQIFGLLSVVYLYSALLMSPLSKVIGRHDWVPKMLFTRRAVGVGAAYFALLHVGFSVFGQLGGLQGVWQVPPLFRTAMLLGAFGLFALLALAITSFDRVIAAMGLKRWMLLHRIIYVAGVTILLHIWMVGTHISAANVLVPSFILLALLFGLEAIRVARLIEKKWKLTKPEAYTFSSVVWLIACMGLLTIWLAVPSYSTMHSHGQTTGSPHEH